ncbi:MAG: glycosyltransferase family 39 protein, partial [Candidatus Saccharimonadales bacterium]
MNTLFDQLSTLMRKIREIFDTVSDWVIDHRDWTILITSLAVATFFRLWKVIWPTDYLPAGLHPSEATVGLAANNIASGELVPLAVNELGSSVIFTYLQSLVALVANNGVLALRILPALISITAVVVVYFAAKSWFSKRAALIAMFFMASSAWATQIGRLGLDFSLAMLILPLIMWLLAIAIRTNQAKWYTLTGLALGLSLYIYPFSWIIPLTIVAILSYAWLVHKDKLKRMYKPIAIMLLATVAILLPLLIYSLLERGLNFEVASISSMFSALISTLMMLHISGDSSAIYNLPRVAHLDAFSGILFILGLILAFIKWRNIRYMSLIILLGVTVLVATILRPELAPSATMMAPAIPIIYILVAVGLSDLLMRWKGVFPFNPIAWHIGAAVVVLAVATSTIYNYNRYFIA